MILGRDNKNSTAYICQRCGRVIPLGKGCDCLLNEIKRAQENDKKHRERRQG